MPNCFCLARKSDPERQPVSLSKIDEEMCQHFKVPVHKTRYHAWWYDIIGFKLACGKSFEQIRDDFREMYRVKRQDVEMGGLSADEIRDLQEDAKHYEHLLEITDWLDANFTSDAWVEIGRR